MIYYGTGYVHSYVECVSSNSIGKIFQKNETLMNAEYRIQNAEIIYFL
jgi:hypothetical protein